MASLLLVGEGCHLRSAKHLRWGEAPGLDSGADPDALAHFAKRRWGLSPPSRREPRVALLPMFGVSGSDSPSEKTLTVLDAPGVLTCDRSAPVAPVEQRESPRRRVLLLDGRGDVSLELTAS